MPLNIFVSHIYAHIYVYISTHIYIYVIFKHVIFKHGADLVHDLVRFHALEQPLAREELHHDHCKAARIVRPSHLFPLL